MSASVPPLSLDGILLLDKDPGMSSNAALQKAKRLLNARKAGHTGSLDPLASGLLPVCLGEATKLAGFPLHTDKRYRVSVRLGVTTDTGDSEGKITDRAPIPSLDTPLLEGVLQRFRGPIEQIPPMYSALKHHGVRLYELARRGVEVDRAQRAVEIHELRLLDFDPSRLVLEVHCSKGTYIRVLAEDIGRQLGCGGYVETLRRTAVGELSLARAHTLGKLQSLDAEYRLAVLEPMDVIVSTLPVLKLDDELYSCLRHGQAVPVPQTCGHGLVRLYNRRDVFFGIGELRDDGKVLPRRLFAHREAESPPHAASAGLVDRCDRKPPPFGLVSKAQVKLK